MKYMKWINTLAYIGVVAVNALAELIPIGGVTTGQVSEKYPNLFTPVPLTFSIWGLIYLLLGLFILYQWGVGASAQEARQVTQNIGTLFLLSCILNVFWILGWHTEAIGVSLLCIAGLLLSLILIQPEIRTGISGTARRVMVNAGFDIYYGWMIAATIANAAVLLVKNDWGRFGLSEVFWTVTMIGVGGLIAALVVCRQKNRLAGATVIWAYGGILIKHLSASGYGGKYPAVIAAAAVSIAGILAAITMQRSVTDASGR